MRWPGATLHVFRHERDGLRRESVNRDPWVPHHCARLLHVFRHQRRWVAGRALSIEIHSCSGSTFSHLRAHGVRGEHRQTKPGGSTFSDGRAHGLRGAVSALGSERGSSTTEGGEKGRLASIQDGETE